MNQPDIAVRMPDPVVAERPASSANGFLGLLGALALIAAGVVLLVTTDGPALAVVSIAVGALGIIALTGLFTVAPGEAKVVQFFGTYIGTVRRPGLHWVNPFTSKHRISTRIRNHESDV